MNLTAQTIKNSKPAIKTRKLFDGGGLYLEVSPKGRKWWRLKYRFGGKEKKLSLGVYPDVTLKDARDRRYQARKLLDDGIDPSEHRRSIREEIRTQAANTFELVAREWFSGHEPTWAISHSSKVMGRLEKNIFPWLGKKAINSIKLQHLLEVIRRIEGRGVLETAHRSLATCGQVFRYAVATGRAERDVSADLRGALPPIKRKHFAAATEPDKVAVLLRQLYGYSGTGNVSLAQDIPTATRSTLLCNDEYHVREKSSLDCIDHRCMSDRYCL